jgi:DNA-binding NtrC family response regulator
MHAEKILLVERDPRLLELLVDLLVRRFSSSITCVSSAVDALDVEMLEPHSLAIVDMQDDCAEGLALAARLQELRDAPIILLADQPSTDVVLTALRIGTADFLPKPFDVEQLAASVERALQLGREYRQFRQRYHRMRALLRRVLRERRVLNDRVELICKDLVGAHRRLVQRFVNERADCE